MSTYILSIRYKWWKVFFLVWDWVSCSPGWPQTSQCNQGHPWTFFFCRFIYFYFMCGCFISMCLYTMYRASGSQKGRGCRIPWNCSYSCGLPWGLWGSSGGLTGVLGKSSQWCSSPRAISSPALELFIPAPHSTPTLFWMLLLKACVPDVHAVYFQFYFIFQPFKK